MASIGSRLRKVREKKNLNQKEAAAALGLSNVVLNRYENDERLPDVDTLRNLAEFYNVTTDYLLGRTENPAMVNIDPDDDIQPTPPERFRTFQKKIGDLSPESLTFLEFQLERLRQLDLEAVERRKAERDTRRNKK